MEHLFLLRKQAQELKMRQMVEEITFGRHTIESAMSKYQVLTRSQKIISLLRLKALVAQLPADRFVRIHNSYIVGLAGIEAIDKDKVQVGSRWLPVSDSYRRAFHAFVERYRCIP